MDGETRRILSEFTEPEPDVTAEMRAELADAPRRYGTEPAPIEFVRAGVAIVKTRKSDASLGEMNFDFQNEYEGQLTIDVYQDKNDIIVESTVAGVNPSNLDIAVTNESVNIRGERRRESEAHDRDFFYRECYWGKFARLIILPQNVDPDRAQATLKNGVLTIRLPKTGEQETKRLKVQFS